MKKTIKAWAVWDGTKILSVGTGENNGAFRGLYIIHNDKENAEKQWTPFQIIECTISYTIPTKKGKKTKK